MLKKISVTLVVILALSLLFALPAGAQAEELRLRLSRDFGYASGGDIQGTFSMHASGPSDLQRVVFYLDDQVLGEVTAPPFSLRFITDNYPLGQHTLSAVGYTASGAEVRSPVITTNFVTPGEGIQTAIWIIVPILALIALAALLSAVVPMIAGRKAAPVAPGKERRYGVAGGAICSRCQRPFPLNFLAINLGPLHKLDRCPHCGRWGSVRRRSIQELRAAEAAEVADMAEGQMPQEISEEEKLRRDLEKSRYQDL